MRRLYSPSSSSSCVFDASSSLVRERRGRVPVVCLRAASRCGGWSLGSNNAKKKTKAVDTQTSTSDATATTLVGDDPYMRSDVPHTPMYSRNLTPAHLLPGNRRSIYTFEPTSHLPLPPASCFRKVGGAWEDLFLVARSDEEHCVRLDPPSGQASSSRTQKALPPKTSTRTLHDFLLAEHTTFLPQVAPPPSATQDVLDHHKEQQQQHHFWYKSPCDEEFIVSQMQRMEKILMARHANKKAPCSSSPKSSSSSTTLPLPTKADAEVGLLRLLVTRLAREEGAQIAELEAMKKHIPLLKRIALERSASSTSSPASISLDARVKEDSRDVFQLLREASEMLEIEWSLFNRVVRDPAQLHNRNKDPNTQQQQKKPNKRMFVKLRTSQETNDYIRRRLTKGLWTAIDPSNTAHSHPLYYTEIYMRCALAFMLDRPRVEPMDLVDQGPLQYLNAVEGISGKTESWRAEHAAYYGKRKDALGRGRFLGRSAVQKLLHTERNKLSDRDYEEFMVSPRLPFEGIRYHFAELALEVLHQRAIVDDDAIRVNFARIIAGVELELRNPICPVLIDTTSPMRECWVYKLAKMS